MLLTSATLAQSVEHLDFDQQVAGSTLLCHSFFSEM